MQKCWGGDFFLGLSMVQMTCYSFHEFVVIMLKQGNQMMSQFIFRWYFTAAMLN